MTKLLSEVMALAAWHDLIVKTLEGFRLAQATMECVPFEETMRSAVFGMLIVQLSGLFGGAGRPSPPSPLTAGLVVRSCWRCC